MNRIRFTTYEDLQRYQVTARSLAYDPEDGVIAYGWLRGVFLQLKGQAELVRIGGKQVYVDQGSLYRFQARLAAIEARYAQAARRLQETAMAVLRPESLHTAMRSDLSQQDVVAILAFVGRHIRDLELQSQALYFSRKQHAMLPRSVLILPDLSICILDDLGRYGRGEGATKTLRPALHVRFELPALEQPITNYEIQRVALIKTTELQRYHIDVHGSLHYARKTADDLCKQHASQVLPMQPLQGGTELSPAQRLQLALAALRLLAGLHERGFIHGDLTPRTVFATTLASGGLLVHVAGLAKAQAYQRGELDPAEDIAQLGSLLSAQLPEHGDEDLRRCVAAMCLEHPADRPHAAELVARLEVLLDSPTSALQERIIAEELASLPDSHDEQHPAKGRLGAIVQSGRLIWERQQLGLRPYKEALHHVDAAFTAAREALEAEAGLELDLEFGVQGALQALREAYLNTQNNRAEPLPACQQAFARLNESLQLAVERLVDQGQAALQETTGRVGRLHRLGRSYRELRVELRRLDLKRNLRALASLDPEQISFQQLEDYARENKRARSQLAESLHKHDAEQLEARDKAGEHLAQLQKLHQELELAAAREDRAEREVLIQPLIAESRRAYMAAVSEQLAPDFPVALEQLRSMAELPEQDIAGQAREQLRRWSEPKSPPDDNPDSLYQWASALRSEAERVIACAASLAKRAGSGDVLKCLQQLCGDQEIHYEATQLHALFLQLQQRAEKQAEATQAKRSQLLQEIEADCESLSEELRVLDWLTSSKADPLQLGQREKQAAALEAALQQLDVLHSCIFITRELDGELLIYSSFLKAARSPGAVASRLEYLIRARQRFQDENRLLNDVLDDYAQQHRDSMDAARHLYADSQDLRQVLRQMQDKQAAILNERKACATLIANAEGAARQSGDIPRAEALRLLSWRHHADCVRYSVQNCLPGRQLTEDDVVDPTLPTALSAMLTFAEHATRECRLRIETLLPKPGGEAEQLQAVRREARALRREALKAALAASAQLPVELSDHLGEDDPSASALRQAIASIASTEIPEAMLRELCSELAVAEGFTKYLERLELQIQPLAAAS